ncbi:MerR family transcriptional regulator [Streptomyces sp. NPDC002793]|uniref:MerR family transcriptional regulator n=1 Tax=Streptomyces sp. NPDC002793 TaxID=3154432 RepID=UPI0033253FF2
MGHVYGLTFAQWRRRRVHRSGGGARGDGHDPHAGAGDLGPYGLCGAVVMLGTLNSDISVKVNSGDVRRSAVRIGELSAATGVSSRSLRYYEQQGLLRSRRTANTYREYEPDAVERVAFIQDLFSAGLSSQVIRDSLPTAGHTRTEAECSALLTRVREVRDELARQELRLAQRRKALDSYLAGEVTPRGMPAACPRQAADVMTGGL